MDYIVKLTFYSLSLLAITYKIMTNLDEVVRFAIRVSKKMYIIIFAIIICLLLGLEGVFFAMALPYWKDVPYRVTNNYRVIEGPVTDMYSSGGKLSDTYTSIKSIELVGSISYKDRQKYKIFRVYYLPNTRSIIKYEIIR